MWLLQAFSEQVPSSAGDLQEEQAGLQILRKGQATRLSWVPFFASGNGELDLINSKASLMVVRINCFLKR